VNPLKWDSSWTAHASVELCVKAQLQPMIDRHYIGKWPGVVVLKLGLIVAGDVLGAIVYALPPRETSIRYGGTTWELARLWIDDSVPRNAETWLIARSVRHIKRFFPEVKCLVSYADPGAGHVGTIYLAANWQRDGMTDQERKTPRFDLRDSNGKVYSRRSHVPRESKTERVPRVSKHRFVLRLK
jgi:hypothetical protein